MNQKEVEAMGKGKPHLEFERLDMDGGWECPEGYPDGIEQKILAADIDEDGKSCLLYTSPSPRDVEESRMPSSA